MLGLVGDRDVMAVTESSSLPERFTVRRWVDPVVEDRGFPVNSVYSETVLLPILGPSSVLCLRRLGSWVAASPNGIEVDSRQLARDLGLGDGLGPNSMITKTVRRLELFGMAQWNGAELSVRTVVAPVPERQLSRLSPQIVAVHRFMVNRQLNRQLGRTAQPLDVTEPEPARSVALGL
jgi:hypothetical protein